MDSTSDPGTLGTLGAALLALVAGGYGAWQKIRGDQRAGGIQERIDAENVAMLDRHQAEIDKLVEQRDKAYMRADMFAKERNDAIAEVGGLRQEVAALRQEIERSDKDIQQLSRDLQQAMAVVHQLASRGAA